MQQKTFILIFFGLVFGFCIVFEMFQSKIRDVKSIVRRAHQMFGKGTMGSLQAMIMAEDTSFKDKLSALWAFGQLVDKRAIPLLTSINVDELKPVFSENEKKYLQYMIKKMLYQINGQSLASQFMFKKLIKEYDV